MTRGPEAVVVPAIAALERAAQQLSDADRAVRAGRSEPVLDLAAFGEAIIGAREWLFGHRAQLLDTAARRCRNVVVDMREIANGVNHDHAKVLAELGTLDRLVAALEPEQDDGEDSRAA